MAIAPAGVGLEVWASATVTVLFARAEVFDWWLEEG